MVILHNNVIQKNRHLSFDFLKYISNYETRVVPTEEKADKRNGGKNHLHSSKT